jgi:NAD(P)-dependent dehydrogenase (short-subunit alcohol dehydrogenase family)
MMSKVLQDRVAIVTGASGGLGAAIAAAFAAEGANVMLAARRAELLNHVADAIGTNGGTALAAPADVTREGEVIALFAETRRAFGRVDILVNNAATPTSAPTEDMTLAQWREALDVNLTGAFLCSREAVRTMKAQTPQGGRILNIGSVAAKSPRPDAIAYTASKFALHGMTQQLTMDGRRYGVVASILHPGMMFTGFTAGGARAGPGPGETPADYLMSTEDVAKLAVLMCSLPPEVNLFEATILPNHMRSVVGRG